MKYVILASCLVLLGTPDTVLAQRWASFRAPSASFGRLTVAARPGVGVGSIYRGGVTGGRIIQGRPTGLTGGFHSQGRFNANIRSFGVGPLRISPLAISSFHPMYGRLSFHNQVRLVTNARLATHSVLPFTAAWYKTHPHSWPGNEAVPDDYAAWTKTSWDALSDWLRLAGPPIIYHVETNEQKELMVHRDGAAWVKAGGRAEVAFKLADLGRVEATTQEWKPVGTFALVRPDHTDSNMLVHLAVNRDGRVRGTYYDPLMDASQQLTGAIEQQTQRVAWEIGTRRSSVMETSLHSLTEDHGPLLVHYNDGFSQGWTMVRMADASPDQAAGPGATEIAHLEVSEKWKALADWTGVKTAPITYNFEKDHFGLLRVFRDGRETELVVYQRDAATKLAARGKAPGKETQWIQLGNFALQSKEGGPAITVQIGVDKSGTVKVSHTDRFSGEVVAFYGAVDAETQHAAWRMNLNEPVVMQLGLTGLATEQATMLAHFDDGWTRVWSIRHVKAKTP